MKNLANESAFPCGKCKAVRWQPHPDENVFVCTFCGHKTTYVIVWKAFTAKLPPPPAARRS